MPVCTTATARISRGFTLVELLVVMVLIGVLATYLSLSMGSRRIDDALEVEARRLEALMQLASDQAQLQGTEIGFRQFADGYEFLFMAPSGQWVEFDSGPLRARKVEEPLYLELRIEGRLIQPAKEPAPTAAAAAKNEEDAKDDDKKQDQGKGNQSDDKKDDRDAPQPSAFLLSSGEATAFLLDVKARRYKSYFRLEGDLLSRFKLERQEEKK